jgi:hypothetical protein
MIKSLNFAIALYETEAESPDELTFKKNDLLQIIHHDYMGMEGWCLCKLLRNTMVGLAPANRLKLIKDEKIIQKLSSNLMKNKKTNSILSTCSSSSATSTSSSSSSSSNSLLYSPFSSTLDTQNQLSEEFNKLSMNSNHKIPLLPSKKASKTDSFKLLSVLNPSNLKNNSKLRTESNENNNNDDDDYDYDIPQNNKSINKIEEAVDNKNNNSRKVELSSSSVVGVISNESNRKSLSTTIDSGISTSSLVSLSSANLIFNSNSIVIDEHEETYEQQEDNDEFDTSSYNKNSEFKQDFMNKLDYIRNLFDSYTPKLTHLTCKEKNFLAKFMHNFLKFNLKQVKQEHACFHPNLNIFNQFKTHYDHLKQFYFDYEKFLGSGRDDLSFLGTKFTDVIHCVDSLGKLIQDYSIFNYHSQSSIELIRKKESSSSSEDEVSNREKANEENDDFDNYQYVYDNLVVENDQEEDVGGEDYSDYCQINESNNNNEQNDLTNTLDASTLKKCEKISSSDNMLLKFYLKHIEEYLDVMNSLYSDLKSMSSNIHNLELIISEEYCIQANKLALYGHKLVFICDTLERNLNSPYLKMSLFNLSNFLCESLKIYTFRVKTTATAVALTTSNFSNDRKKNQLECDLILDSMNDVFNTSNQLKQIIFNNHVKSF